MASRETPDLHGLLERAQRVPSERLAIANDVDAILRVALPARLAAQLKGITDAERELAIDHVIDALIRGGMSGYRGGRGEKSALAYVTTAAVNKIRSERRSALRRKRHEAAQAAQVEAVASQRESEDRMYQLSTRLFEMIVARIPRTKGIKDPATRAQRVWLAYDAIWSYSTTQTILQQDPYLLTPTELEDPATLRRARNLLDQHRRRGRMIAGQQLYYLVVRDKTVDKDDAVDFAAYNRIPLRSLP